MNKITNSIREDNACGILAARFLYDFCTSDRVSRLSKCKSDVSLVCIMVEYASAENSDLYKTEILYVGLAKIFTLTK